MTGRLRLIHPTMALINSYRAPDTKEDHSFDDPYDLNSCIPVPPLLETSRVQVVPFVPVLHGELFFEAYHKESAALSKYFPEWTTLPSFLVFIETLMRQDANNVLFIIIDKTKPSADARAPAGRIAGLIGWLHASPSNLTVEMGPVLILNEFQRTHVAANAIGLVLKYVLDTPAQSGLGFRRVSWYTHPLNIESIVAAEKMGFEKEGVMRWTWVLSAGKEGMPVTEGRGEGDGRHSVLLSVCWDKWESGTREVALKRMERVL